MCVLAPNRRRHCQCQARQSEPRRWTRKRHDESGEGTTELAMRNRHPSPSVQDDLRAFAEHPESEYVSKLMQQD